MKRNIVFAVGLMVAMAAWAAAQYGGGGYQGFTVPSLIVDPGDVSIAGDLQIDGTITGFTPDRIESAGGETQVLSGTNSIGIDADLDNDNDGSISLDAGIGLTATINNGTEQLLFQMSTPNTITIDADLDNDADGTITLSTDNSGQVLTLTPTEIDLRSNNQIEMNGGTSNDNGYFLFNDGYLWFGDIGYTTGVEVYPSLTGSSNIWFYSEVANILSLDYIGSNRSVALTDSSESVNCADEASCNVIKAINGNLANQWAAGEVRWMVYYNLNQATMQAASGSHQFTFARDNAGVNCSIVEDTVTDISASGTLTGTWACAASGDDIQLSVTWDSSLGAPQAGNFVTFAVVVQSMGFDEYKWTHQ